MTGDNLDILHALAQGRHAHRGIQYQLIQLAAKESLIGQALQIGVAGCNHTHVKEARLVALLQRRQSMRQGLGQRIAHFQGQLFDLIQEQRTANSQLQLACGLLLALVGAKEFAFQLL